MKKGKIKKLHTKVVTRVAEGFFLLLPFLLLVLITGWIAIQLEAFFNYIFSFLMPSQKLPSGVGLALGTIILLVLSFLIHVRLARWIYSLLIRLIKQVPLLNSIYLWVSKMVKAMTSKDAKDRGVPVSVSFPFGEMIGFLTAEDMADKIGGKRKVAVYLPMSYQIGGFMILVDPKKVEELEISTDEAFSLVLSAGLVRGSKRGKK